MPSLNQSDDQPTVDGCGSTPRDGGEAPVVPARREYWRSLDDLKSSEDFRAWMHREFPSNADLLEGDDRRQFMKLMGASFALAGLGAAACRRIPEQKIVPYATRPQERIPGKFINYASSLERGGVGHGIVVRSFDARPVKIEGNPDHSATGGSDAITQSEILRLYDPHRSRQVLQNGEASSAAEFESWIGKHAVDLGRNASGAGSMAILAEASGSPSMARMREELAARFPQATWHEWEPIDGDGEREGTRMAFGAPHRVQPMLEKAEVVVCLDADPLHGHAHATRLSKDWASRRRLDAENASEQKLSRVYSVEGILSVTGIMADDRIPVRPGDVAAIAAALASRLGVKIDGVSDLAATRKLEGVDAEIFEAMVKDLDSNRGSGIVMAGEGQPPVVHALAAAMNVALGNVGKTVVYTADSGEDRLASIGSLVKKLEQGIDTLVIIGGNPVYDAPADLDFASAMKKASHVVHLSYEVNETSMASEWHLPRTHFLESWGDTTAFDGMLSMTQPLIEPMIDLSQKGWSGIELVAALCGAEPSDGYSIVRATEALRSGTSGATFESHWRTILDKGVVAGTTASVVAPSDFKAGEIGKSVAAAVESRRGIGAEDLDFQFLSDSSVYDGRFVNNGWLQELPDPITKITWDNALLVSPSLCKARGLREGDMVTLKVDGRSVDAAVFPVPGMDQRTMAMAIGWGRGEAAGPVGMDAGFDAYPIRTTGTPWIASRKVSIDSTGKTYAFAQTQDHGAVDAIRPSVPENGIQERLPTLVRETTLDDYRTHPDFAKHRVHVAHRLSLWEETNLDGAKFRWAMTVDLNTCTGCGACITACQAENNIPVVGKDQIARGREMHWLRIDRYFKGTDPNRPEAVFVQPVMCMQCENAPCEQVCPVAATVHDKDGLNVMVYNRCIGTRYCSNNCPYKVRRFNWFDYWRRDPVREQDGIFAVKPDYYTSGGPNEWRRMQFNPEVTVRTRGVMEKCSFCTQRIQEEKIKYKNEWARKGGTEFSPDWTIPDGAIQCACEQACSTGAIVFGDLNDSQSKISKLFSKKVAYELLEELNTKPRIRYLARVTNPAVPLGTSEDGHGGHGDHSTDGNGHTAVDADATEGARA